MTHAFAGTLPSFQTPSNQTGRFYSLPALAREFRGIRRLPRNARSCWASRP